MTNFYRWFFSLAVTFFAVVNNVFADAETSAATDQAASPGIANFIPLILIFLIFYFLLIRPQQKKIKEHQHTIDHLKVGDKVYTNGGLIGVIKAIDKKEPQVDLEVANQVVIKIVKNSITDLVRDKEHKESKNKKDK